VNIGSNLLTDPVIVLLDKLMLGLDNTSAVALMRILHNLARDEGKTIITSIHQPSLAVLFAFDVLMLLADGKVVYLMTTMTGTTEKEKTIRRGGGWRTTAAAPLQRRRTGGGTTTKCLIIDSWDAEASAKRIKDEDAAEWAMRFDGSGSAAAGASAPGNGGGTGGGGG